MSTRNLNDFRTKCGGYNLDTAEMNIKEIL
jgi:hypothetical protein